MLNPYRIWRLMTMTLIFAGGIVAAVVAFDMLFDKELQMVIYSICSCYHLRELRRKAEQVKCDGCKLCVHAECDRISSNAFKGLCCKYYYCPDCQTKFY